MFILRKRHNVHLRVYHTKQYGNETEFLHHTDEIEMQMSFELSIPCPHKHECTSMQYKACCSLLYLSLLKQWSNSAPCWIRSVITALTFLICHLYGHWWSQQSNRALKIQPLLISNTNTCTIGLIISPCSPSDIE